MMLAVKRVKLPASGWLNRQDKPLPRRGMFPVEICEIHSLGRYSREILIRSTARAIGRLSRRKKRASLSKHPPERDFFFLPLKNFLDYFLKPLDKPPGI